MVRKTVVRYSEAFKLQVLREMEEGKFPSKEALRRAYGIRGGGTLFKWIIKYGKENLLDKVVRVETPKEVSELKQLRKRIRELEKGLADAHLDLKLEEAYTRIACKAAGIEDVDGFKKKHGGSP
ncbi:MAG: transposase [Candidatus Omnitrophica bacterium]|nr:transposase [Candidatus Omnitrophota bacterium]